MSIRLKVILPYLILTILVAITGVYVVTKLVAGTVNERLTNQLLEAGRATADNFVREEQSHVEYGSNLTFTAGLAAALKAGDRETTLSIARPSMVGRQNVENLVLITPDGQELVHLVKDPTGKVKVVERNTGAADTLIVAPFLKNQDVNQEPMRTFGINLVDNRYYYYTAMPVPLGDEFAGVIVIGTSLDTIVPYLKNTSLADIIIYAQDGKAIATSLGSQVDHENTLQSVSISAQDFNNILIADGVVSGSNFALGDRKYSLARGPLQVGNDRIGAFAVVLPLDYVVQSGNISRNLYIAIYTLAMLAVILIGYLVSRLIVNPLYSLVRTSQAIAGGDLKKRTGIEAKDEIGLLAHTFDEMTENLQQRTMELEKTNAILQQMDRTKGTFIQISAHELRTPLTLIMGYSAMLEQKTKDDPEFNSLVKGILDGSNRMTEIVDSMLDVSRIDNNSLTIKKINLQINMLIQKVHKSFMFALDERKMKFNTIGLDQLPLIPADPEMLFKVFYHIVMNAIKYTPDGGTITVKGCVANNSHDSEVEISVKDTGIGIDPKSHDLIFNKFYQTGEVLLHSSGKTKFKGGGPGLGLSIARGIVEAHRGRIWAESIGHDEVNYPGSTFYVRLPIDGSNKASSK